MEKQSEGYSDTELKVLLRYATDSYRSILEATNQLTTMIEAAPKKKSAALRKPARTP